MMNTYFNKIQSTLVLNGDIPLLRSLLFEMKGPIIAADGAAEKLALQGIVPDYTVGDGDSTTITKSMIRQNCQETTDFEKCLFFLEKMKAFPTIVLGLSGGEIDHVLGNFQIMLRYAERFSMIGLDSYKDQERFKIIFPISSKLRIPVKPGKTLSIIPSHLACLTSRGLRWELGKTEIGTDAVLGLRNETTGKELSIDVHRGKVLMIYDL